MRIYLITHAHTEQAPDVAIDHWMLSMKGIDQTRELAKQSFWGDVDRVVISSEAKTYLTIAEVARARSLPIWVDSRFDELRRSGWIEDYSRQVCAVFAEPSRSVGNWESVDHVRQRAVSGLAALQARCSGQTLALVGHGLCLSILRAEALGLGQVDFSAWQRLSFGSFASITLNPLALLSDFSYSESSVR